MNHPLARCCLAVALCAGAWAPTSASAEDARFALVIGHNDSDDPELQPLRYADDDALRYYELLRHVADDATLLTSPDDETRRLLGDAVSTHALPTRDAVLSAVAELQTKMAAAKAAGKRPVLYFVYSGHGNYDAEGRGYVHLADGRFTARDLFHRVLRPARDADDPVVLIVDACNASLLVNSRGAAERRPTRPSDYRLEHYPNVGVILASSTVGETHEWGRYLAGIFSHEVRSGLLGAADLDDDGRISFGELAAFVAAANARVTNPNVRVTPYIRPPLTAPNLPIIDLAAARFPARLRMDGKMAGKAHIVDADLIRYADFHVAADGAGFWLALTRTDGYVLVRERDEHVIPAGARGDLRPGDLEVRKRTVLATRGAGSAYFDRTLFHQPYGKVFAHRYLQTDYPGDLRVQYATQVPWYENTTAWAVLGSGVAAAAAGLGMQLHALSLEEEARDPTIFGSSRHSLNSEIETFQTTSAVLYGVGGAAAIGSVLLFVLDRETHVETYDPPLSVELTGPGVRFSTDW